MAVFESNCPKFFAPNEREEYKNFLAGNPPGYEVCLVESKILGAFGTWVETAGRRGHVCWIMIDPSGQGCGIGTAMMERVFETLGSKDIKAVDIAASQKSAPFFARFGAVEKNTTPEGWGPGLDRVDMEAAAGSRVRMASAPQIRPGVPTDAKTLAEAASVLFLEAYEGLIPAHEMAVYVAENYNETRQQSELADPAMAALIVEHNNRVVGFAQLHQNQGPAGECDAEVELRRIYMAKEWYGTGLAQQLIKEVAITARSFSARAIWLAVWDENFRAISFYKKIGFRPVGVFEFRLGSLVQNDIVMQAMVEELL